MSDTTPPPKRRVVVRITAREKKDPAALLNAVRNSLSGHGVTLQICTIKENSQGESESQTTSDVVKDEPLETKARAVAESILATAQAEADKKTASAEKDASRAREEIIASRAGTRAYLAFWFAQGVRITVEVYQKAADAVVELVFGGKGKKGE